MAGRSRKQDPGPKGPTQFAGVAARRAPQDTADLVKLVSSEARILVASGRRRGTERTIRAGLLLGRDPTADFVLEDDAASRRHAMIERRDDGYWLRDLGSANGTYSMSELLHGRVVCLKEGDRFQIGDTEFVFHDKPRS
jgi:pSer/pThr/pTyr-binding forkhead associated (FHA) protein